MSKLGVQHTQPLRANSEASVLTSTSTTERLDAVIHLHTPSLIVSLCQGQTPPSSLSWSKRTGRWSTANTAWETNVGKWRETEKNTIITLSSECYKGLKPFLTFNISHYRNTNCSNCVWIFEGSLRQFESSLVSSRWWSWTLCAVRQSDEVMEEVFMFFTEVKDVQCQSPALKMWLSIMNTKYFKYQK